jgi:hypothetical protein
LTICNDNYQTKIGINYRCQLYYWIILSIESTWLSVSDDDQLCSEGIEPSPPKRMDPGTITLTTPSRAQVIVENWLKIKTYASICKCIQYSQHRQYGNCVFFIMCNRWWIQASLGLEPRLSESKSEVLTIAPQHRIDDLGSSDSYISIRNSFRDFKTENSMKWILFPIWICKFNYFNKLNRLRYWRWHWINWKLNQIFIVIPSNWIGSRDIENAWFIEWISAIRRVARIQVDSLQCALRGSNPRLRRDMNLNHAR